MGPPPLAPAAWLRNPTRGTAPSVPRPRQQANRATGVNTPWHGRGFHAFLQSWLIHDYLAGGGAAFLRDHRTTTGSESRSVGGSRRSNPSQFNIIGRRPEKSRAIIFDRTAFGESGCWWSCPWASRGSPGRRSRRPESPGRPSRRRLFSPRRSRIPSNRLTG